MKLCAFAAFCVALWIPTDAFPTISVSKDVISARLGKEATLPCWLSPTTNVDGFEVLWYRIFETPVLLYRDGKIKESLQAEYVGRTSFKHRNWTSEGLKEGDLTLKLANVTLNDEGEYVCYVSRSDGFDLGKVHLNVTVMGTPPLLSVGPLASDSVSFNVSCESHGWKPQPRLQWSDGRQTLAPENLGYSSDGQDLVEVHSWLISSSPWVSCSLGLSAEEMWEGRVKLENSPVKEMVHSEGWKTAFIIAILLVLLIIGISVLLYFKKRASFSEAELVTTQADVMKHSVPCDVLKNMKQHAVDVTLDRTESQCLKVTVDGKSVRDNVSTTEEQWATQCTFILGKTSFSSGFAYWEVELGRKKVGLKESWGVGLASETVKQQQGNVPLTPSNGFWFLSSEKLKVDTEFRFFVHVTPEILGVYLDYDKGEVSFYNIKEQSHIATLATKFTGEVFPFFLPGRGDTAPLRIKDINIKPDSENSNLLK